MSLARTLMGGVTESAIDTSEYVFENVSDDSMWVDSACESLVADIYNIDKAYHIADIMGEVKVLKEGADGAVILEGMIKNAVEKIQAALRKFWAKLKAWFEQVKKFFKSFLLTGKKFVAEFGAELKEKDVKGFTYNGYRYNLKAGDDAMLTAFTRVMDEVDKCAGGIKANGNGTHDYGAIDANQVKNNDSIEDTDDWSEKLIGELGVKNAKTTSELSEELAKIYRGGEDAPEDIEDFSAASVSEMLDCIGGKMSQTVSTIEKLEKEFEADVNKIIKALEGIKKAANDSNDAAYKIAKKNATRASGLLAIAKIPTTVASTAWKEAAGKYRAVLGAFYRWKPAKEGAELDDEDFDEGDEGTVEESSIFEAAMRLI